MGGGGETHFGISEGKGGVKTWKPSMVGYGYFQELPITCTCLSKFYHLFAPRNIMQHCFYPINLCHASKDGKYCVRSIDSHDQYVVRQIY